jgi:hypothetical protein
MEALRVCLRLGPVANMPLSTNNAVDVSCGVTHRTAETFEIGGAS